MFSHAGLMAEKSKPILLSLQMPLVPIPTLLPFFFPPWQFGKCILFLKLSGPLNAAFPIGQGLLTQHPENMGDLAEAWPGTSGEGNTRGLLSTPRPMLLRKC